MRADEATHILTIIEASWPRNWPNNWEAAWIPTLSALPFGPVEAAVFHLVNTSVHPPSVAELRVAVAAHQGAIAPDPTGVLGEEWAKRARDAMYANRWDNFPEAPHPLITEGVAAFGGVEAVMEDRPSWRKFWAAWRQERIAEAITDEAILQAHTEALTRGNVGELGA